MMEKDSAVFILDRPFADKKTEIYLSVGTCLKDFVPTVVNKPDLAYVVLVNGRVSDMAYCVKRGDVVLCVPQLAGG